MRKSKSRKYRIFNPPLSIEIRGRGFSTIFRAYCLGDIDDHLWTLPIDFVDVEIESIVVREANELTEKVIERYIRQLNVE